tara:strand:+ start:445 stop:639 length:195 start_codon:yes stop_codon:yes gene_type:complete
MMDRTTYPVNPVREVKFDGVTFFEMSIPMKSWGGWYESFPFSRGNLESLRLRGNTLEQGFKVRE